MPKKNLPFVVRPQSTIVAIGNEDIGVIHLLSKRGISPNENPIDLQAAAKRQIRAALIVEQGTKRLMEARGLSRAAARKLLFGMQLEKPAAGEAETIEEPQESLYDYIPQEQAEELVALRDNESELALQAATLFIKYRVAYPVRIVARAAARSTELQVFPIEFPIAIGDQLKVNNTKIKVTDVAEIGDELIKVEPLAAPIEQDAIAYLLDERGRYKIGNDEWTIEDTREYLTEDLIVEIYNFYRQEAGGIPDMKEIDSSDESGKLKLKNSQRSPTDQRSTGENSTGDSNSTDAGTNGSTQKILETAQIG